MSRSTFVVALMFVSFAACAKDHGATTDAGGARDAATGDAATRTDSGVRTDSGAAADAGPTECDAPSDCVVVPVSCCGSCGRATPTDFTAIAREREGEYRGREECATVSCPACEAPPLPQLIATCDAGRCVAIDLGTTAITACTRSEMCTLGVTASCCPCGDIPEHELFAYSASQAGALRELLCPGDFVCPPCVPFFPAGAAAVCDEGRCSVALSD